MAPIEVETAEDSPSWLPVAQKLRQVPYLLQKPLYEWLRLESKELKKIYFRKSLFALRRTAITT